MTPDSRHIALTILIDSETNKVVLDQSLNKFSKNLEKLSKKDRALTNSIIFGTLRFRAKLDWTIKPFSNKKIEELDSIVIWALRIALFQIMFMDKIPVSAAVNTAVNIVKAEAGRGAANFTNAVLRKASKNYSEVKLPDKTNDPALFLSIDKSMPLWLVKRWIKQYGIKECLKLCDTINSVPFITIRTNTLKTDRSNLFKLIENDVKNACLTKYADDGISFTNPSIPIHTLQSFKKGLFQVQDQAAQITTILLNPLPGETILDACAGNGGKTAHAAQLMQNKGRIVATDTSGKRLLNLEKEIIRLSLNIVETKQADILKYSDKSFDKAFDKVLVDAPCTGLGVLRRNPDAKWNKTYKDIKRNASKQKRLLSKTAQFVKPGGNILFSVCSSEKEENEDVIEDFLKQNNDFKIDKNLKNQCLENQVPFLDSSFFTDQGFFKSFPHAPFMDGFFVARLIKNK
ncbi:MAG: 16S rRNA (cytosine(967)-C(5))-methyltransferase RsmB [Desulfobacteraceae bacterium]|nr:16S rRNA (cytosine(967)-C(5))-methyltransferase RsmB [Desulfobacteraceae bacterium]